MARGEFDRVQQVMDWPLRELMLCYIERLKETALRTYETSLLVWSALAPHQRRKTDPPAVPAILKR